MDREMTNDFQITANGRAVKMRTDEYAHGYYAAINGKEVSATEENGFSVAEENFTEGNVLHSVVTVKILKDLEVGKLFLRSGIDCYMETYPQWNSVFFPTMLHCEETHFTGYIETPEGVILAIASPDKIEAWSLDYNRVIHAGGNDVGHRIYTFCLHFFNEEKSVSAGRGGKLLKAGDTYRWEIVYGEVKDLSEVKKFWAEHTGAPTIECGKYTYEIGEKFEVNSDGKLTAYAPDGSVFELSSKAEQTGLYRIKSEKNGVVSNARLFVRDSLDKYLKFAGECAFRYPQRPSTHAETYYGYFSAFACAQRMEKEFRKRTEEDFAHFCNVIETEDGKTIRPAALPNRVQNTGALISLFAAAYRATGDEKYLDKGIKHAEALMEKQAPTGEYIGKGRIHYTCVIYPAKNMLELWEVLPDTEKYGDAKKKIFDSAYRAIRDLSERLDNIETEGQQTFEDGMISCEALQLGMMALISEKDREFYTRCAEIVLKKHECLEQKLVSDARMRGCTLRFWESMYDVLIDTNMINSPHGWTSWKTYATFYLYLLTENADYLTDTFDTLGASLQCFDLENDRLYWAFIVDPVIKADVFTYDGENIELKPDVFGECYLPMISDKWQSDRNIICNGIALPRLGKVDGEYRGGCCDNDVHEHIKCLEEVGLNAFVHEENGKYITYNCDFDGEVVKVKCKWLKKLYFRSETERKISVEGKTVELKKGMNTVSL